MSYYVKADLSRAHKMITIIKALRLVSGWGLKETKDLTDTLQTEPRVLKLADRNQYFALIGSLYMDGAKEEIENFEPCFAPIGPKYGDASKPYIIDVWVGDIQSYPSILASLNLEGSEAGDFRHLNREYTTVAVDLIDIATLMTYLQRNVIRPGEFHVKQIVPSDHKKPVDMTK